MNLKVVVAMNADKVGSTQAEVVSLNESGRMKNGLKLLGISWGVALLTVFIPVFHFVLVPSFLLIGIVMFFVGHKKTHLLTKANITCPNCGNNFAIKNISFNWPLRQTCNKCSEVLLIVQ